MKRSQWELINRGLATARALCISKISDGGPNVGIYRQWLEETRQAHDALISIPTIDGPLPGPVVEVSTCQPA